MRSTRTLFIMLAVGMSLALAACSDVTEPKTPEFKTKLKSDEIKNSAFKAEFPLHYETYLRNNESTIMTEYGGSVPYNKHDNVHPLPEGYKHAQPYLKNLWLGYVKKDERYRLGVTDPVCELVRFLGREIDRHDPQAWFAKLPLPLRRRLTDCEVYEYVEVMP